MYKPFGLTLFLFLMACGESQMGNNKPIVQFQINDNIQNAIANSSVDFKKDCMLGICLYKYSLSFASGHRAAIAINPASSTSLQYNDGVGVTLGTYESETVNDAAIILGGVDPDSSHSLAMKYFRDQADGLLAKGWHRFIMPNEARLPGSQAKKFDSPRVVLDKPIGTGPWNDPALVLSQAEWLAMPMFSSWYFYKDGVYLTLRVQRENNESAPEEKGSYLFTLTVESEAEFYKSFFESDDREQWTTLLPAELNRMAQERAQTEARLKKMGIAIDENYQDPPIKALE